MGETGQNEKNHKELARKKCEESGKYKVMNNPNKLFAEIPDRFWVSSWIQPGNKEIKNLNIYVVVKTGLDEKKH